MVRPGQAHRLHPVWPGLLAAAAGGASAVAVLQGIWWLAVCGAALLSRALIGRSPGQRFTIATVAGLIHVGVSSAWLGRFNLAGAVALVLLQAVGWGLAGLAVSRRCRWPWPLVAAMALSEYVRGRWPLGGYPFGQLWLSQADGPLAPLAPWIGRVGVTAKVVLLGVAITALLQRPARRVAIVAAFTTMVALAASLSPPPQPNRPLEVAAVQGGGPRGIPAVRTDPAPLLGRQVALTRRLPASVDLVVWPEGALTVSGRLREAGIANVLPSGLANLGVPLVTGVTEHLDRPDAASTFANAAVVIEAGQVVDRYDKRIRVPFGEFVPFRSIIGRMVDLSLVPRDALVGREPPVLDSRVTPLGVAISYEGMFSRVLREAVTQGAQLLVIPTNAASYVTDEVPDQQLAAARFRARELGRDLAINGPTGPTALIDADGRVLERAPYEVTTAVQGELRLRRGLTAYARFGDAPVVAALASSLCAAAGPAGWRLARGIRSLARRPAGPSSPIAS